YDQVGLADGSPQLAVEPEGALGLEVAAQYDLRVEHGASRCARGRRDGRATLVEHGHARLSGRWRFRYRYAAPSIGNPLARLSGGRTTAGCFGQRPTPQTRPQTRPQHPPPTPSY